MALLERWRRWRKRREIKESDRPLEYGDDKRYHMVFRVIGGNMYKPNTYYLSTSTNKKELSQPEMNAIAGELLRRQYGGSIFDVHVVKRYDTTTGKSC